MTSSLVVTSLDAAGAAALAAAEKAKLAAAPSSSSPSINATNTKTDAAAKPNIQPQANDDPDAINGRGQIKDVHEKMWLTQPGGAKVTIQNEKNLVSMNLVSKRVDRIISDIAKHHGLEQFGYPANASQVRYRIRSNGELEIYNPQKAQAKEDPWMPTTGAVDSAETRKIYEQTQKLVACDAENRVYTDRFVRDSDSSRPMRQKGESSNESETVRLLTAQVSQLQTTISMMQGFAMLSNKLDTVIAGTHLSSSSASPPSSSGPSPSAPDAPKVAPSAPKKTIETLKRELSEKLAYVNALAVDDKDKIDEKYNIKAWMKKTEARFATYGLSKVENLDADHDDYDDLKEDYNLYLDAKDDLAKLASEIRDTSGNRAYDEALGEIVAIEAELHKATEEIKAKMAAPVATPFFKKQEELKAFLKAHTGVLSAALQARKSALEAELLHLRKGRKDSELFQEQLDLYVTMNQEHELFQKDLEVAHKVVAAETALNVLVASGVATAAALQSATTQLASLKAQLPGKNAHDIVTEAKEAHRTSYATEKKALDGQIANLKKAEQAAEDAAKDAVEKAKKADLELAAKKLQKERMTTALAVGGVLATAFTAYKLYPKASRVVSSVATGVGDFVKLPKTLFWDLPQAMRELSTPLPFLETQLVTAATGSLVANATTNAGALDANEFLESLAATTNNAGIVATDGIPTLGFADRLEEVTTLPVGFYDSIMAGGLDFLNRAYDLVGNIDSSDWPIDDSSLGTMGQQFVTLGDVF